MELALIDVRMLQYQSSVVAASALCIAYKLITKKIHPEVQDCEKKVETYIRESLGYHSGENADNLLLCCRELHFLQVRSMNSSLQAVRKKFQGSEFAPIHAYIFS
jgi:Cyclin, C-terminal domain